MRPDQEEFFTVLYREYFNQIKLYAMAHISDPHRAEEIAQDTFHTAVEKIDKKNLLIVLRGWLISSISHPPSLIICRNP